MGFLSDIEIAQQYEAKDIRDIAKTAGIDEKYLEVYGRGGQTGRQTDFSHGD